MRSAKNIDDLKILISFTENYVDEKLVLDSLSNLLIKILNKKDNETIKNLSNAEEKKTQSISGEISGKYNIY